MNKMKTWYNMTTDEEKMEAEVSIYDSIGGEINAKSFVEELNDIQAETIHLRINSPGGSVVDGVAILNALKRHSAKVVAHIDGIAASMASAIAVGAADEVWMADNALMMIHNPWTISMGDADELRADADLLDKMQASILSAYGRSQYTPEQIQDLMDKETWFSAQEAMEIGFVDHIEGGLRAAAADFAALAESNNLSIPAEKQVVSLTKQIEAITKASKELSEELEEKAEQIEKLAGELVEAKLENEQAAIDQEAAEKGAEAFKALWETTVAQVDEQASQIEAKEAEIEEAKDITEQQVSNKAAELLQMLATEPVADLGNDDETKISAEEFWEQYHALDYAERNVWYAENKHRKI